MAANRYAQYKQMEATATEPVRLIVMLYDGAVSALKRAIGYIEIKDYEKKGKEILKAHAIVFELMTALDMEKGGEIAANLQSLYVYILKRILEANASLDVTVIEESIRLLEKLNEGWKGLARQRQAPVNDPKGAGLPLPHANGA